MFYRGRNASGSVPEESLGKPIPRDRALTIYCVGNGFGRVEGFDRYYRSGQTYRTFINRLVSAGLLAEAS